MGKDLTEVRSSQRTLIPDAEDWEYYELPALRGIARKAKQEPRHRFRDLSRCLNETHLRHAFSKMNKKAASGVDNITYNDYQNNFDENIGDLIGRLKRQSYKARLVKRKHIPKSPGKTRPLGLPVFEDKLVQTAGTDILSAIYEQDFYDFSYGYRPKRGSRQCADDLSVRMQFGRFGYVVEADIKGFFNNIDHDILLEFIALRVDDKRFLRLISKWLKAGILEENGEIQYPDEGTPQGGSISPISANIYLHYVIDEWFEHVVKPSCEGDAIICRYADDFVCAFQYAKDADRFYDVLPKRLEKYNLEVATEKTNRIRFSRFEPSLKNTFTFLSFEFYWSYDKAGKARLFRRTSRKRLQSIKNDLSEYIKKNRHKRTPVLLDKLTQKLRGHYNYFGVVGNLDDLFTVYFHAVGKLYKWLNRRSGRKSMTWKKLKRVIAYRNLVRPVCKAPTKRMKV
ncbi:MAG: RNA-directed DNA polymerase [Lentisphaeria bacterium]|jgi:RNA-directed DNA polymerase